MLDDDQIICLFLSKNKKTERQTHPFGHASPFVRSEGKTLGWLKNLADEDKQERQRKVFFILKIDYFIKRCQGPATSGVRHNYKF